MSTTGLRIPIETLLPATHPPGLGPGPRNGVASVTAVRDQVAQALPQADAETIERVRALVWLWQDHSEEAHEAVQDLHDRESSWIHAILHRREPDYSNARYWFHRVGQPAAYATLGDRVKAWLKTSGDNSLLKEVMPNGKWDGLGMVAACEASDIESEDQPRIRALIQIQVLEFRMVLEQLISASGSKR